MILTNIILYGSLGERFGKHWQLAVHTPKEIVDAISCKFPNFRRAILEMSDSIDFGVTVGERQIPGELWNFPHDGRTITVTPLVRGSDDTKGWINVIAGVVLIAAGIAIAIISQGGATQLGISVALMGVSLVAGGVAQLLTPSPSTSSDTESKSRASYQFGTITNSIGQGGCVPVLLGGGDDGIWIGSHVISAGYENVDITAGSNATAHTLPTSQTTVEEGALPIEHDDTGGGG